MVYRGLVCDGRGSRRRRFRNWRSVFLLRSLAGGEYRHIFDKLVEGRQTLLGQGLRGCPFL